MIEFLLATYFVIIIPYNNVGDASGCNIESFTTGSPTNVEAICVDFTLELDATGNATLLPSNVDGGSNNPDGPFTLSLDITSFTCNDLGDNTVILSATDQNGGSTSCTATVTVVDNTAPSVVCQDITVMLDASGTATILAADVDNNSTDNCSIASLTIDIDTFDCTNLGANTVTLTATDNASNTNSCTATVTVVENEVPTAICQDITVSLDSSGNATITADQINNGSFFGCDNTNVDVSLNINTFDCSNLGENTVTLTAENNGETDTCVATVTVIDTIAPEAMCQNISIELDATGNATITADQINNGSTDNCGVANLLVDIDTFDCSNLGDNTVTLTVTDTSNNTTS